MKASLGRVVSLVGLFAALVLASGQAYGQDALSTHIFPQLADGYFNGTSSYTSVVIATNENSFAVTCNLSVYGMSVSRFYYSSFTIPAYAWVGDVSLARLPLASGYGRLDCSAPVVASAVYSLDDNGTTLGWATVFSSPPASYGMLPVFTGVGYRYGLSIANDNSVGANYSITFTGPDGRTSGQIISIPAKSQYVGFADTLVSIPNTPGAGTLEITPQSGQRFSVAALVFAGAAFTTFVPTTLP